MESLDELVRGDSEFADDFAALALSESGESAAGSLASSLPSATKSGASGAALAKVAFVTELDELEAQAMSGTVKSAIPVLRATGTDVGMSLDSAGGQGASLSLRRPGGATGATGATGGGEESVEEEGDGDIGASLDAMLGSYDDLVASIEVPASSKRSTIDESTTSWADTTPLEESEYNALR